jgi:hypothetical protein
MVCDGYLDLLIRDLLIYYLYCVMDILDLLVIHIIVIMRIYCVLHLFDTCNEMYPFQLSI